MFRWFPTAGVKADTPLRPGITELSVDLIEEMQEFIVLLPLRKRFVPWRQISSNSPLLSCLWKRCTA
jgi:hypothetical protein